MNPEQLKALLVLINGFLRKFLLSHLSETWRGAIALLATGGIVSLIALGKVKVDDYHFWAGLVAGALGYSASAKPTDTTPPSN